MNLVTLKDWSRQDILAVVRRGRRSPAGLEPPSERSRREDPGAAVSEDFDADALLGRDRDGATRRAVRLPRLGRPRTSPWRNSETRCGCCPLTATSSSPASCFTSDVLTTAESSMVPVMNGCCDRYHPMQILADLQTIHGNFRTPRGNPPDLHRGPQQRHQLPDRSSRETRHGDHRRRPRNQPCGHGRGALSGRPGIWVPYRTSGDLRAAAEEKRRHLHRHLDRHGVLRGSGIRAGRRNGASRSSSSTR